MFASGPDGHRSCASCGSAVVSPGAGDVEELEDTVDALFDGVPTPANTAPSGWTAFELDHSTAIPTQLSAAELVDAVIGFDRVAAWAMARQQELISEFHHRPDNGAARPRTTSDAEAGSDALREWAGEEIALALTLATGTGAARVAAADRLAGVLRPTRDLLESGRISPDRARLVNDMLWGHDDRIAAAVQERVLPRASGMTWGQLRAALTRAILAEVPDGERRHRRAHRDRRVDLYPGQDGMATLSAFLSAAEATASFEWVTRLARGVQPAADGAVRGRGSMDRRRADVLVALLTGRLVATTDEAATATPAGHANTAPGNAAPTETAPAGTASGHADCRNTAPTATAPTATAPTATAPGHAAPTDTVPSSVAPSYTASGGSTPTGTARTGTGASNVAATDTASARLRSSYAGDVDLAGTSSSSSSPAFTRAAGHVGGAGGAVVLAAPVSAHRPLIHITMPLSTLLGLDDEPAELAGYGPLPADVARDIALDPDGTWRRLLTDPVTGRLLDHGRTTYRPPTGLAGVVRTRDGTCRHPGCRRPAIACELDHVHPWAAGGVTSEDNICALCERHHDLKEQVGWQVVLHGDRTLEWTTPTGHRYRSRPVEHPVPPPAEQPPADPAGAEAARAAPDPRTWGRVDPFTLARASAPAGLDDSPPF